MVNLYSVISEANFDVLIATIAAGRYEIEFTPTKEILRGKVQRVAMSRATLDAVIDLLDASESFRIPHRPKGCDDPVIGEIPIQVSAFMQDGQWFPIGSDLWAEIDGVPL